MMMNIFMWGLGGNKKPSSLMKIYLKKMYTLKSKSVVEIYCIFCKQKNLKSERVFFNIGSEDETSVGRLVVTEVTVPQYGVEGKHAVLYCR